MPQDSSTQGDVCRGARAPTRVERDSREFWEKPHRRKDEQKGQRQGRARRADTSLLFTRA